MRKITGTLSQLISWLLLAMIKTYQYAISPLIGSNCRFYPTCSNYTREAIEVHGAFKGGYLGLRRLLKCHPYHDSGVDLVPELVKKKGK